MQYDLTDNITSKSTIAFEVLSRNESEIEVREGGTDGKILATCRFSSNTTNAFMNENFNVDGLYNGQTLCLVFKPSAVDNLIINRFSFN